MRFEPSSLAAPVLAKRGKAFKDYWQRGNETDANRSGDHIDLWNKSEITSSSMLYRSFAEFFGMVSDLNNSKKIWFWEVK
ncbi:T6SS effector amidase Tae4 family protein [Marinobacter zhanjiangensis]|uniref:T6SS effector amidase Tae4 family protein n=1 Tax=Marinobacter zhanjiangensis TaxID=578215 RepID=UPI001D1164C2